MGGLPLSEDESLGHRFDYQGTRNIIGVYFREPAEEKPGLLGTYLCYVPLSNNVQNGYFRVSIHVMANFHHALPYGHKRKQRVM